MTILAIDPGPEKSGWVKMDANYRVLGAGVMLNGPMIHHVASTAAFDNDPRLVIEKMASMGMAVGEEVLETCFWTGMFADRFSVHIPFSRKRRIENTPHRIPRVPIKVHLCGTAKAKDANIRQALIDRYGGTAALQKARPEKRNRKGEVTSPAVEAGALAGVSSHAWAALAVAVVYLDRIKASEQTC